MVNKTMLARGNQSSVIRELFEYGKIRKKEIGEENVFDFSIGNPSVPCPDVINNALIDIINNYDPIGLHGYSSAIGHAAIRESVASFLNEKYNANAKADLVLITAGAAPGLASTFNGILNEGEEVIVLAPFWPEYRVFVEKAGGKIVISTPEEGTFLPDFEDLSNKINEKTKAVVINSPNNPTGVIYSEEILKKLSELLNKKQKELNKTIFLVSDEPYRELNYIGIDYPFVTKYYDNSIVVYSFSKAVSLPGERIGYVLVSSTATNSKDVYNAIKGAARVLGYVCASTLFQQLIPFALGVTSDLDVYKENQEIFYQGLTKLGYEVVKPQGAFYLFVKALEEDAKKFSDVAKGYELLIVPSDSFGVEGYVRISYCVSKEQIINSLPIFEKLMNHYKNK